MITFDLIGEVNNMAAYIEGNYLKMGIVNIFAAYSCNFILYPDLWGFVNPQLENFKVSLEF